MWLSRHCFIFNRFFTSCPQRQRSKKRHCLWKRCNLLFRVSQNTIASHKNSLKCRLQCAVLLVLFSIRIEVFGKERETSLMRWDTNLIQTIFVRETTRDWWKRIYFSANWCAEMDFFNGSFSRALCFYSSGSHPRHDDVKLIISVASITLLSWFFSIECSFFIHSSWNAKQMNETLSLHIDFHCAASV